MSISFSQPYDVQCPACGAAFVVEAWVLVDAAERPELAAAVQDITLHDTRCPRCGQAGVVGAPLLYHDAARRKVLFGVPPELPEDGWPEVARQLLWMLIGALPETQRLPYLGDVQAEAGVAGVAAALEQVSPMPQTAAEALGEALGSDDPEELPVLAEALMALLEVKDAADFDVLRATYPFLLDAAMDEGLAGLAEAAIDQGEIDVGQAFERARLVLSQLRQTLAVAPAAPATVDSGPSIELPAPPPGWHAAVQALLALDDPGDLPQLVAAHPVLANPDADGWLQADEALVRDMGDLAQTQALVEARAILRGERS